ncbi:MAG: ABC transporter substrate-binding protein, partial [Chloroflexota bacterium]|nr:ABC transporter substrate-binding protein [Chloroflexota bacterium]
TPKPAATNGASTPAVAVGTNGTAVPVGTPTAPPSVPTATAAVTAAPGVTVTTGASTPAIAASTSGTAAPVGSAVSPSLAGKVTLYTSAVQTDADGLKAAFNKKYPNVAVTIYRDGTEKVIAKLRAEQDAKSIQADVLLIADAPTMENLKADKFLQPYKSPFASALDKQFVDAEGYYTGTKIINSGIAVNTTANLPKPATWKDLLKPEYKGKLVSPSPQYSGAAALNYAVFLNTTAYGADFVKGLQRNGMTVVQANGDALNKIISGEAPVGIVTDNGVRAAKAKGSPVEMIYPTDGAIPVTEPIAVVAGTKNLDAAKAFVDFVLSPDGQALIVTQNYIPLLLGLAPPAGVPGTVKEFAVDAPAVAKQLSDAKKQFTDIFGA